MLLHEAVHLTIELRVSEDPHDVRSVWDDEAGGHS